MIDSPRRLPPLELLAPFERTAFRLISLLLHEGHHLSESYTRHVGARWVWAGIGKILDVRGLERLAGVRPTDPILIVSNHRSFFDLYILFVALYHHTDLKLPIYCPVRADFFYQQPLGVLVNLLAGGGRMYPPVFREPSKSEFNKWAIAEVAAKLRAGGVLVGMHPEGTRNKNLDPYTPLPAQPGVGKLVMDAWPVVVPAFINGLSNDILVDIKANFERSKRVIAVFGEPVALEPFKSMGNRLSSHKRIADHLMKVVYALGEEERRARAEWEK